MCKVRIILFCETLLTHRKYACFTLVIGCIAMFLILTFIQIYKILRHILITNNNFTFSCYILIVQPSFSLVSAEFQPNEFSQITFEI